LRGQEEIVF